MYLGSRQILCHFVRGTSASMNFGIQEEVQDPIPLTSNQSPSDTEGQLTVLYLHSVCKDESMSVVEDRKIFEIVRPVES
jgi:hypothetical protein